MGKYEVTQGEYLALTGNNPSWFNGDRTAEREADYGVDLNRPVEQVGWDDAVAYCVALTQQERAAGRIPFDQAYRLPTEAEWEYACRAGTTTRFSYGDDPDYSGLADYAWYSGNSNGSTHPVGQKLPNPWGLHDMLGNVWELCQDWFGAYPGGAVVDPQGPDTGWYHVIRGGRWDISAKYSRSAFRYDSLVDPGDSRHGKLGFRVVLAPVEP
jgi:formylglycine-generating enzyme required for sulfatase activity